MSFYAKVFKVMIASPADVLNERDIIRNALVKWNAVNSESRKIVLLPVDWETHSTPEMGDYPQKILNKQILKDSDLLVGVFWIRIGTPTHEYPSGTVEEIEEHIKTNKPAMIYFSSVKVKPDEIDTKQYNELNKFKDSLKTRGLYKTYSDISEFKSLFDQDLSIKLNKDPYFTTTIEEIPKSIKSPASNHANIKPFLSIEALVLLLEANRDRSGDILRLSSFGGLSISTNGKEFIGNNTPEEKALWEGAIEDLEDLGFIKDRGNKREIFKVTREGYKVITIIKNELNKLFEGSTEIDIEEIYNKPDMNIILKAVENALTTSANSTVSMDVHQDIENSLSLTQTPSLKPTPKQIPTTPIVVTKPIIQNVTLTTEKDGQDTVLVLTLIVESNAPVNWLNDTLNGPHGNIYGGGLEIFPNQNGNNPSSTEVSTNIWQVVHRYSISRYAPSGDYSYSNVSVKNTGMLESKVWPDELKVTI
jgi:hypothetical protein